jgi:hypothetical protein
MIHLKRFEAGPYWTSKRTDPIIFPAGHRDSRWHRPLDLAAYEANDARDQGGVVQGSSEFELTGVVNHHGSFGGGHYTAYTYKGAQLGWTLCNDDHVKRVEAAEVIDSQEYLLMYKKRCSSKTSRQEGEHDLVRMARAYVLGSVIPSKGSHNVMVRKDWLHRVATYVAPGPLFNRLCYCCTTPRSSQHKEHFHETAKDAYVEVALRDYVALAEMYGGPLPNKMPQEEDVKQMLVNEVMWMRSR